ncbi:SIR2 family protein [Halalkaliarchaeum sp. AArc-GB]|uniref:SIR2 family protein n=1 Tax=Halalkaliarchaeum sp. AArc-GB TaxID=3074078 RepID=UPI0028622AD3|nr:SIR2 family protein [Halalkaliarchaeum sp. AArc-GB]MDR5673926.1 SIR2 family protein [Halalkaliarchaeum sp. AArc-GB]
MDEIKEEDYQRLCERLSESENLSLFCGAGISVRAGVPSGQTIIGRLEDKYANQSWPDDIQYDEAWNRALPGEEHREQRRSLIEQWFTGIPPVNNQYPDAFGRRAYPGNHYLIASLVDQGVFGDVVTTNFDHLLEIAFMLLPDDRFRICQYDDQIDIQQFDDSLSKLFKLHGDFLYDDLANLSEEMRTRVDESLQAKLTEYLQGRGLVVLGYNGHDDSIMTLLEEAARSDSGLTEGLWWVSYSQIDLEDDTNTRIRSLKETMDRHGKDFELLTPKDDGKIPARDFLLELVSENGVPMPTVDPFGLNLTDHFVPSIIDNDTHFPRQNALFCRLVTTVSNALTVIFRQINPEIDAVWRYGIAQTACLDVSRSCQTAC